MSDGAPTDKMELSADACRFRALVEGSSDAIFVTDFDSAEFVEVNQRACKLFGYEASELHGKVGRELHPPGSSEIVDEISSAITQAHSVTRNAIELQRKDGSIFRADLRSHRYEIDGKRLYITFVRDVSAREDRKRELRDTYDHLHDAKSQLSHSARLAAVGQLAAGIAHEVNNPAAYVLTNLELLANGIQSLQKLRDSADYVDKKDILGTFLSETGECVEDCLEGLGRIATIVKGLRAFARIDREDVERFDPNESVITALNLVRAQVRHSATLQRRLNSTKTLAADRGKLVQVLVNLLMNAAHAIEDGGGGSGSIVVESADTPEGIRLSVTDDGPGVDPLMRERIFDPFFTTKSVDRGTGLGLSLCSDILRQHQGSLVVDPAYTQGARFEIMLPAETGLAPATVRPTGVPNPDPVRARILIVDDEVALVRADRRSLGRYHDVLVAYDGQDALDLLKDDQNFDMILCDLMMPIVNGIEFYEKAALLAPQLRRRFVFCTGGATTVRALQFISDRGIRLLEKPIDKGTLNNAIHQSLQLRESLLVSVGTTN